MLVANHGFINPDIGVIAWVNLSRSTAPTMTGLKAVFMTALAAEFFSMSDVNRLRILQDVIDHRLIIRLAATQPGLRYLTDTVNGYWSAIVI